MKKCAAAKNPCRICLEKVTNKTGLQCRGACKKWAHFSCLNYTPGRIHDIRKGYIIVNCPCPDCRTDDVKEILTRNSRFICTNTECPAIKPPKCELPDCHANKLQSDSQSSLLSLECAGSLINLPPTKTSACLKSSSPKRVHSPNCNQQPSKPLPDIDTDNSFDHFKCPTKKKTSCRPLPASPNIYTPLLCDHKTPENPANKPPFDCKLPSDNNAIQPLLSPKCSRDSSSSNNSTPPKPLPTPNKPLPVLKTDASLEFSDSSNCSLCQSSSNTFILSKRPGSPKAHLPHPPPPCEPVPLHIGGQPPGSESLHTGLPSPCIKTTPRKVTEEKKSIHQSPVMKLQSISYTNLSAEKANIEDINNQKCSSDTKLWADNRKVILSSLEQMCAMVGQLTNQIKDLTCQMLSQMEKNC